MKKKLVSVLLCAAMVAAMAAGCGGSQEDTQESKDEKESGSSKTEAVSEDTMFGQALAQVDEDLAPLPEKDTGKKLAAIESTLSNSFWVTMQ